MLQLSKSANTLHLFVIFGFQITVGVVLMTDRYKLNVIACFVCLIWIIDEKSSFSVLLGEHFLQLFTLCLTTENVLFSPPHSLRILSPPTNSPSSSSSNPTTPVQPIESLRCHWKTMSLIIVVTDIHCLKVVTG